jgi:cyclophilin family peptidyl-prolyl cis-trans isomerase
VVELDPATYPATVNSFAFLARQGFYDGSVFHRIASNFVIQGGDPEATGTGGPAYLVPDEFPPDDFVYEEGVVAMANAGGGTTGSQFFVVVGDNARVLNNTFNVLGRVVSSQETLDAIEAVPTSVAPGTSERSRPVETVYIESIEISQ